MIGFFNVLLSTTSQVLTTISSTGMPIQEVEFPAITFCSPGFNDLRTVSFFLNLFYEFMRTNYGWKVDLSPLEVATLLNKVQGKLLNVINKLTGQKGFSLKESYFSIFSMNF
jgi:hypothetical protein